MPRIPEPWYWQARKCWYIQVNRKHVRLAPGKAESRRLWQRMLIASDGPRLGMSVADVVDLFLESRDGRREETSKRYRKMLGPFVARFGTRRLDSIRPPEVEAYCLSHAGWGPGTRRGCYSIVSTMTRWARDAGYLEFNVMAGMPNPWPAPVRARGMTDDEYATLQAGVPDPEMRLLLRVFHETGCRPGEAFVLAARHLHPMLALAILEPHEHKTGGRTGKPRSLYFNDGLMAELRKAAARWSEGPILRNTRGRPWTQFNVAWRFARFRERFGLAKDCVPYSMRHGFITRMVHDGADLALLAKMVGHQNAATLQSTYFHAEQKRLLGMADRAQSPPTSEPQ
jgi:integrase